MTSMTSLPTWTPPVGAVLVALAPVLPCEGAEDEVAVSRVVVVGQRASLATAAMIKRSELGIVDSVVAEDIIKLPDFSVTDALQRVTGVQIARDRGEGAGVTIRGLTQMETTLNGREVFTAGTGRTLDFADLPAEMVAGIDVHKTSSAGQIEGGVGGSIDVRTRRPFDFAGSQAVVSGRWIHGDLVRRDATQFSTLLSQRWRGPSMGEFGALLAASLQERAWREDQKSTGNPVLRNDLAPGLTAPNGTSETTSVGTRRRSAVSAVLQWRPVEPLELHAEAAFEEFKTRQDSHQINVGTSATIEPGSLQVFPGTNDLQRVTWLDAPISILSFARDTVDRNRQLALGGRWRHDDLTLRADISHARSFNHLLFSGPFLAGTAARFTHDLSGKVPSTQVDGTDLTDPADFRYTGVAYRARPFDGDLTAAQVDAELALDDLPFRSVHAGLRTARRNASNSPGLVFADAPVSGLPATDKPGFVLPNPYNNFFPGHGTSLRDFIVGNLAMARDPAALRDAFGISAPIPVSGNPLSVWDIRETTQAAYLMGRFKPTSLPVDGQLGLRLVQTHESVSGTQTVPTSGALAPIQVDSRYTDLLPSASVRHVVGDGVVLRAAASKTLTRPNFDQLSPSLTLLPNPINPSLNQGFSGNPELKPIRATNLDLAVERYVGAQEYLSLTGFVKWVDGFITNSSAPEVHDGATYQVSRPKNNNAATIRGAEVGGQMFFQTLPAPWNGLGLQANYTYIDSQSLNVGLGIRTPLQGLSRNSANLIGLFEQGPLAARVAFNWRDRFISGTTSVVGVGALPIYTHGYGWLDASLSYRVGDRITLAVDGTNLLGTMRRAYYGVATRPQANWINDRQYSVSATLAF